MKLPLFKAIGDLKDIQEIKEILRSKPSLVFVLDKNGKSPLHIAVEQGHYEIVDFLLVWGSNPNIKDAIGHTPLHSAIIHKHFEIAKLLIINNALVNSVSTTGKTPLHFLADHNESEETLKMAKFLLLRGAYPYQKDQSAFSPIDKAEKSKNIVFLELLKLY